MKPIILTTAAAVSGAIATAGLAANYELRREVHLPVSMTEAWHLVGDFCDIDDWHPDVAGCSVTVIDGRLHRVLTAADGSETVEQRIAQEPGLSYTYRVSSSPLPVEGMIATFSVEPADGARITWSVRFSSEDPAMEAEVARMLETGMSAIEAAYGSE